MLDRIIGDIRVSMTKKGCATKKNERHNLVTPELLGRKWGIGLENAKEVLKATTGCHNTMKYLLSNSLHA